MKSLSILSLASIAGLVACNFVVIDEPVHARKAAALCEKKGYTLAKLKGGKHSNIKAATKALYKAKVGEGWIAKLDGKKHHNVLYLSKPANFKKDREAGDVFRAQCDGDDVCNEVRAVLCDDGKKKSKKSKKSKKHSRRSSSSSSSSGYCNPEQEYCGEEEESIEEEPAYRAPAVRQPSARYGQNFDNKPAKYY